MCKSGCRKIIAQCRVGHEFFPPRAEWAAKIFPIKTHLTPLPPQVINNDRSLTTKPLFIRVWRVLNMSSELDFSLVDKEKVTNFSSVLSWSSSYLYQWSPKERAVTADMQDCPSCSRQQFGWIYFPSTPLVTLHCLLAGLLHGLRNPTSQASYGIPLHDIVMSVCHEVWNIFHEVIPLIHSGTP